MRSVMMKPPTTLIVAQVTAMNPRIVAAGVIRARHHGEPTSEMALIAFVADMRGVCRSAGTRVMVKNPTNPARTKT
jgi:hypothetical protein